MAEEQQRLIYDHLRSNLDFRRLRPTGVKSNSKVYIPRPRDNRDEQELRVRKVMRDKTMTQYLNQRLETNNLTPAENRVLMKLVKRIQAGEIVVYPTDKSGKLAVATLESYETQGGNIPGQIR